MPQKSQIDFCKSVNVHKEWLRIKKFCFFKFKIYCTAFTDDDISLNSEN